MIWRLFFTVLARLPLSMLHGLGHALSRLLLWLPSKPKRIAATNLQACLPELSDTERSKLLSQCLSHFGQAMLESPALWFGDEKKVAHWITRVHGAAQVDEAFRLGHGIILFTPHIGSWEMVGLDTSRRWPITHLYKAQKGTVDQLILEGRSRFGAKLAPSDGTGVRMLLSGLKAGEAVGILPDQDPPTGSGIFVPFFGHSAHTPVLPAKLASRKGIGLFLCWAQRTANGFEIHYEPAPAEVGNKDPDIALTALNSAVEALVRRLPEQYWWGYPRFRRRPDGEKNIYSTD